MCYVTGLDLKFSFQKHLTCLFGRQSEQVNERCLPPIGSFPRHPAERGLGQTEVRSQGLHLGFPVSAKDEGAAGYALWEAVKARRGRSQALTPTWVLRHDASLRSLLPSSGAKRSLQPGLWFSLLSVPPLCWWLVFEFRGFFHGE